MNFGTTDKKLGKATTIWYPATGHRDYSTGEITGVGSGGYYQSCTGTSGYGSYVLGIDPLSGNSYRIQPADSYFHANSYAVRCLKQ